MPPIAILSFAVLLLNLTALVFAKGGGKASSSSGDKSTNSESGGSESAGSSSTNKGSSSSGSSVHVVSSGSTVICYNARCPLYPVEFLRYSPISMLSNEIVPCHSSRTNVIVGAVIGGIIGFLLLAYLIYWIVKRFRAKRRQREKKTAMLPTLSFGKQEYQRVGGEEENV
ncbi:hypothetical protein B0H11DRAFT_1986712 [Mycena galericulata]|nr:hypothetical protein B0H11DRAFT_1986712 [Mycena galericulata]